MTFDDILALKPGDVRYECESGYNIRFRVVTTPVLGTGMDDRRTAKWEAVNTENSEPISYLVTEGMGAYGPRLYEQPQYGGMMDGDFVFPLVGAQGHHQ